MDQDFLTTAKAALQTRLEGHDFKQSVSLRIKDIGNLFIFGAQAEISDERADCAIISNRDTLQKILDGELHPMKAILFGKMKVAGDVKTAAQFGTLFG